MSLYNSIVRENAPIRKTYNDFYGLYKDIAGTQVPTEGAIKAFQMSRLRIFSIFARTASFKTQAINNFLQQSSSSLNEQLQDSIIHKRIAELERKLRNEFFDGWSNIKKRGEPQDKLLLQETHQNLTELYHLLQELQSNIEKLIPGTYINKLNNYINSIDNLSIHDVMKNYWNLQGEILEVEGTQWFNERMPSDLKVRAFNVGKLNVSGKGQLISDILILDMSLVNLYDNIQIDYKLGGKLYSCSLKQFLKFLETYSGTEQIVLDDKNIGQLISRSVMGIQAKSGQKQLPWNKGSKNTWVSIADFEEPERHALDRIFDLRATWDNFDKNIKTQDQAYNALADYGLATVLNKVLHLDETENSYVLTPSGFMTYEDRIEQLFDGKGGQYYFHLNNVKMDYNLYNSKQVIMPT